MFIKKQPFVLHAKSPKVAALWQKWHTLNAEVIWAFSQDKEATWVPPRWSRSVLVFFSAEGTESKHTTNGWMARTREARWKVFSILVRWGNHGSPENAVSLGGRHLSIVFAFIFSMGCVFFIGGPREARFHHRLMKARWVWKFNYIFCLYRMLRVTRSIKRFGTVVPNELFLWIIKLVNAKTRKIWIALQLEARIKL